MVKILKSKVEGAIGVSRAKAQARLGVTVMTRKHPVGPRRDHSTGETPLRHAHLKPHSLRPLEIDINKRHIGNGTKSVEPLRAPGG